jgi:hypothetical protein
MVAGGKITTYDRYVLGVSHGEQGCLKGVQRRRIVWLRIPIDVTRQHFTLRLRSPLPTAWHEVTIIADGDRDTERLSGVEVWLGDVADLSIDRIADQFRDLENVNVEKAHGLLYIQLRKETRSEPGFGFGRIAAIGIDPSGDLAAVRVPWDAPGAGTPVVNPSRALAGLSYPPDEPDSRNIS